MTTEPAHGHYDPHLDWDTVVVAGAALLGEVADIAYHNTNPAEGWDPFADPGDVPALIAEVRGHIERLESAVGAAKRAIEIADQSARDRQAAAGGSTR